MRPLYKNELEARAYVDKTIELMNRKNAFVWIISYEKDCQLLGTICLWNFSEDRKVAEVGYDLLPEFHKKGIMSEALKAVLEIWAFYFEVKHYRGVYSQRKCWLQEVVGKKRFRASARKKR